MHIAENSEGGAVGISQQGFHVEYILHVIDKHNAVQDSENSWDILYSTHDMVVECIKLRKRCVRPVRRRLSSKDRVEGFDGVISWGTDECDHTGRVDELAG